MLLQVPPDVVRRSQAMSRSWVFRRLQLAWVIAVVIVVGACASTAHGISASSVIKTPGGWQVSDQVAVVGGDLYYLATATMNFDSAPDLWQKSAGHAKDLGQISVKPDCEYAYARALRKLPDGRLGAIATCHTSTADGDTDKTFYIAIDVAGGKVSTTVIVDLPSHWNDVGWDADMKAGWLTYQKDDDHGDTCAGIARIAAGKALPFGDYSPSGIFDWPIDAVAIASNGAPCSAYGEAAFASVDQLGDMMFMASPSATRKSGPARMSAEWGLFSLNRESRQITTIVGGFVKPIGIATSLDGQHVLVSAARLGVDALWLVDTRTGEVRSLVIGSYGSPTFGSDGHSAITTDNHERIVQIDFNSP
jgi:hypothetical protein